MGVEWDPAKAAANLQKHGISFEDASAALYDPFAITVDDPEESERRFATVGLDALGRVVVIVFTWRADTVRLISARKATAKERRVYVR